jgi:3-dehydroquinate dehydratase
MDLELTTSEELMKELINRTTFVGIIIHSKHENRGNHVTHSNFTVKIGALNDEQAIHILELALDKLKSEAS